MAEDSQTKDLIERDRDEIETQQLLDVAQEVSNLKRVETAILKDEKTGAVCELQSSKYDARELLEYASQGINFIKTSKLNKLPRGIS